MCSYKLEMENSISSYALLECGIDITFEHPCVFHRSKASNCTTVFLAKKEHSISYNITTFSKCTLQVENIVYSNDGPSDEVSVLLNRNLIGKFYTKASNGSGHSWNIFKSSKPVGGKKELDFGNNVIIIMVNKTYEVELDRMTISVHCDDNRCPIVFPLQPQKSKNHSGAIIVGTIGSFVVIILLIVHMVLCIYACHKRNHLVCNPDCGREIIIAQPSDHDAEIQPILQREQENVTAEQDQPIKLSMRETQPNPEKQ